MTRLLAVDLGERRIGLAVGDDGSGGAVALRTIPRARTVADDVVAIGRIVVAERIDALVVGLPLDRDGSEGPQAQLSRAWAEAVQAGLGRPVGLRDERHSSQLAEERVGRMPRGRSGGPPTAAQRERHRQRVDREAAVIILEAELRARSEGADR